MGAVSRYTAVVKQHGDWWLGWVAEVPGVNAQAPRELPAKVLSNSRQCVHHEEHHHVQRANGDSRRDPGAVWARPLPTPGVAGGS